MFDLAFSVSRLDAPYQISVASISMPPVDFECRKFRRPVASVNRGNPGDVSIELSPFTCDLAAAF
jgi:hypothetical protein